MTTNEPIPVIDLFSGPGGLSEGFSAPSGKDGRRHFRVALSIEKDPTAHRTLRLRAFLRKFQSGPPNEYYEHLNGLKSREPDWSALYPVEWKQACDETPCIELGSKPAKSLLRKKIQAIRRDHGNRTVLLGGPPCQSYSVAGRARNAGNPNYDIGKDQRLALYKEYALALRWLQPSIAVMENVKGILSARYNGQSIFEDVLEKLRNAGGRGQYGLFTLSPETGIQSWDDGISPKDFLIRAEEHGVPQRRHRVFVICIRSDIASELPRILFPKLEPEAAPVTINDVIGAMPLLRSRLSREDGFLPWQSAIEDSHESVIRYMPSMPDTQARSFRRALKKVLKSVKDSVLPYRDESTSGAAGFNDACPERLRNWLYDDNLAKLPNNETRGHIPEDIGRYLYAATFASVFSRSPRAKDFPKELAPRHANWETGKFADRFRVQLADQPATTITSHISKDGHYFIHPDPAQCRSLTVREAARIQTFPDNYFFHGGRTQQYVQVGNAVPPYLAWQIAEQVAAVFKHRDKYFPQPYSQIQSVVNGFRETQGRTVSSSIDH